MVDGRTGNGAAPGKEDPRSAATDGGGTAFLGARRGLRLVVPLSGHLHLRRPQTKSDPPSALTHAPVT